MAAYTAVAGANSCIETTMVDNVGGYNIMIDLVDTDMHTDDA